MDGVTGSGCWSIDITDGKTDGKMEQSLKERKIDAVKERRKGWKDILKFDLAGVSSIIRQKVELILKRKEIQ